MNKSASAASRSRLPASHVMHGDLPHHDRGHVVFVPCRFALPVDFSVTRAAGQHQHRAHVGPLCPFGVLWVRWVAEEVVDGAVFGAVLQRASGGRERVLVNRDGLRGVSVRGKGSSRAEGRVLVWGKNASARRGGDGGNSVLYGRRHDEELHRAVMSVEGHHASSWGINTTL